MIVVGLSVKINIYVDTKEWTVQIVFIRSHWDIQMSFRDKLIWDKSIMPLRWSYLSHFCIREAEILQI